MKRIDPLLEEFRSELKQRLLSLDSRAPQEFTVDSSFLLKTVWDYLSIQTKECLAVPGCCWVFAQSSLRGDLEPMLLVLYKQTAAIIADASRQPELKELCTMARVVMAVDQLQVIGADSCVRCYLDHTTRQWIQDFPALPTDWDWRGNG